MESHIKLGNLTSAMQVSSHPASVQTNLPIHCGPIVKLTPAETLVELKIEWVGDRSVKLMVRDVTMTFST